MAGPGDYPIDVARDRVFKCHLVSKKRPRLYNPPGPCLYKPVLKSCYLIDMKNTVIAVVRVAPLAPKTLPFVMSLVLALLESAGLGVRP